MASESFDFEHVTRVTAGAVGDPGKRAFYLQLRAAGELVSLAVEKDQLRALTERLQEVFSRDAPPPPPPPAAQLSGRGGRVRVGCCVFFFTPYTQKKKKKAFRGFPRG